jgi:hypothetical protein
MVNDMRDTPQPVLDQVARAIQLTGAEAAKGAKPAAE